MIPTSTLLYLALCQAPQLPAPDPALEIAPPGRVRIADISSVKGMRTNELVGTGLVLGLDGTGDSARVTRRALANLLEKQNINVTPQELKDGSAALVLVTAKLPSFAREGDRLDVTVSVVGDATSLFGGTLLFTPLNAADGQVYAVAQGAVTIGGFTASGQSASITQNHQTVGSVARGATVELDLESTFVRSDDTVELRLHHPDFTTATRMVQAINGDRPASAFSYDPSMVRVRLPNGIARHELIEFVSGLLDTRVTPHQVARVIISERTGTIIAGENVRIGTVAIAHGNLTVTVSESPEVSQPLPRSRGTTTTVPRTDISATIDGNGVSVIGATTSIGDLAGALNALGATPRDLITILRLLERAGSLHAELEVM